MNNPIQTTAFVVLAFLVCCLIAYSARRWMKPQGAEQLAKDQLFEARRHALTHRAQAELHAAMADMYDAQAKRLELPPVQRTIEVRTKMDKIVREAAKGDGPLPKITVSGDCTTPGHAGFGKFWAKCPECEP